MPTGAGDTVTVVDGIERVRAHFDAIGDAEWDRMAATPRDRVSFELHRRLLAQYLHPGDRVLEIGAGPGRFTIELARLGAQVTVTDISPVQLALNEHHVREHGYEGAVESRLQLDVRDAGDFGNGAFDAVVAYGGPLSYVFEDAGDAFRSLVSVTRPGGFLLASVMASVGSFRYFLPLALEEAERYGGEVYDHVLATGDLRVDPELAHLPDVPMVGGPGPRRRRARRVRRRVRQQLHVDGRRRCRRRDRGRSRPLEVVPRLGGADVPRARRTRRRYPHPVRVPARSRPSARAVGAARAAG